MSNSSPRMLFGGAIEVNLQSGFIDMSSQRPVPDNQEIFLYTGDNTSVIFELLDSESLDQAVAEDRDSEEYEMFGFGYPPSRSAHHFRLYAEDNDCDWEPLRCMAETVDIKHMEGDQLITATGYHLDHKSNTRYNIATTCLYFPEFKTDLVMHGFMKQSLDEGEPDEWDFLDLHQMSIAILSNLHIVDPTLFIV